MSRFRVCIYAICKDEVPFVDRWMDSMSEADAVYVLDTGSTDGTPDRLLARGATVAVEAIVPWRFDVARNRSLALVPDDFDICVSTDLDEVFEPGWRAKLEAAWRPGVKMADYLYNWSLRPDGTPDVQFLYFKAHARHDFIWKYPVHECLEYTGAEPAWKVMAHGMVLNHLPDLAKSRGSYLPLLELGATEYPNDDRMAYYLGREYFYKSRWQDAISALKRHLTLPSANWADERCASMRLIAQAHMRLGDPVNAYVWFFRAVAEQSAAREPFVEFAQAAYNLRDWPTCFLMATEALKIKEKTGYVSAGYAWDFTPDDLCTIACWNLGLNALALAHARAALAFEPDNPRLRANLIAIERSVAYTQ